MTSPAQGPGEGIGGNRPRKAGWVIPPPGVDALDHIFCPRCGQHIARHKIGDVQESRAVTCEFRAPPGNGPPCGAQLLVVIVLRRVRGPDGELLRKVYVAEVDWRELAYLERAGMDVFEMLAWLGRRYEPPPRPPPPPRGRRPS